MAESEPSQRVQFGDGIHPVRSPVVRSNSKSAAYSTGINDIDHQSISEKAVQDPEDAAARIADDDRNLKKKQVSLAFLYLCHSPFPVFHGS